MTKVPVIDARTKQDLIELIKQKAESYTPEWRFDENNPDVGTALAYVFADMQFGTLNQYNKLLDKNRIEFFNSIHASMKTAEPASGYAVFGLVNQTVEGVELSAGTVLTTEVMGQNNEKVPIETKDDVYVSPTQISKIYESYDKLDYIGKLYDAEQEQTPFFPIFGFQNENIQIHEFYFSHPDVLKLKQAGIVEISCYGRNKEPLSKEIMDVLMDKTKVHFSYSCEDGFQEFEKQYQKGQKLCFEKTFNQPPVCETILGGKTRCFLRCQVFDYQAVKKFAVEELYLLSRGFQLKADCIYANGIDSSTESCFPFGEQFGIYHEVYFASEEVLSKKGALIQLSYQQDFVRIPLDYAQTENEINWKLIMPKGAVKVEKEYDISIEEVIWEYFNGYGWVKLFSKNEYKDIFGIRKGTQEQDKIITFLCPKDIKPALVNAAESYYIRARIIKVNNAYKTMGQYITPRIKEIQFQFEYMGDGLEPDYFFQKNNCREELLLAKNCLNQMYGYCPISQPGDNVPTVYLGTELPFREGPLRMLFHVEQYSYERKAHLFWEYYSQGRWKELNLADETEHFRKTGLITFSGSDDASRLNLFGQNLYWIRIMDRENEYEKNTKQKRPVISGIYINAVRVSTTRSDYQEFFTLNQYQENFQCTLLYQNIHSCEVWSAEPDLFTEQERELLMAGEELKQVYNSAGMLSETWVKWNCREGLTNSSPSERHYVLDANEGKIRFGDNKHGKIPSVGITNGIRVTYSVGGGAETNLRAGAISGLDLAAGFINQVSNPCALSGGYDKEIMSDAILRNAGEIKHQFRAVTLSDYEKLAFEASRNIQRVKCFSGYNQKADREYGHVALILLQKDYLTGRNYFMDLQEKVYSYLKDKVSMGLIQGNKLHIMEPLFVSLHISAEVFVSDYNQMFDCKKQMLSDLEQFMDPVAGNFNHQGWEIGQIPGFQQIQTVLKETRGMKHLKNLSICCSIQKKGRKAELDLESVLHHPFVLPLNGEHKIIMRVC